MAYFHVVQKKNTSTKNDTEAICSYYENDNNGVFNCCEEAM